jgi:hypothetical protein
MPVVMRLTGILALVAFVAIAPRQSAAVEDSSWRRDWVVLTVTDSGAWGAGRHPVRASAMAAAIEACQRNAISGDDGCGARMTTVRGSFSLALTCGSRAILVTAGSMEAASRAALDREIELGEYLRLKLQPCRPLVAIDP